MQAVDVLLPVEGLYVPAAQGVLAEFPVEGQYAPASHSLQADESLLPVKGL